MVFLHEAAMIGLGLPHVKGRVLALFVGTPESLVTEKSTMLLGLFFPDFTVRLVNRDALGLDREKYHVDEHGLPVKERPGLFSDDTVGFEIILTLEGFDG